MSEEISYKGLVRTLSFNEKEIISWIILLHNNGQPFDVDPTYSIGRFWKGLQKPKHKYDIKPQIKGVEQADARKLPLENESVESVMFDPPFIFKDVVNRKTTGIIEKRFSGYKSHTELWQFYYDALIEFWRILRSGGMVAFKCQDTVSGRKQYLSHYEILKRGEQVGYYCKDIFILARQNVLWSPNMLNQQHARKHHSYFLVFKKQM